jgi:ABC-type spermidine/putrescine transport system permease subunit I
VLDGSDDRARGPGVADVAQPGEPEGAVEQVGVTLIGAEGLDEQPPPAIGDGQERPGALGLDTGRLGGGDGQARGPQGGRDLVGSDPPVRDAECHQHASADGHPGDKREDQLGRPDRAGEEPGRARGTQRDPDCPAPGTAQPRRSRHGDRGGPRWRLFFRYLLIVPLAFSPVIQVLTWQLIYDPNVGVLNDLLGKVGLEALENNWLGDPNTALWALIFINFPWVAGLPFLLFSAGLQNIPGEIFDAAAIDGAGRWKRFLAIDLPLLLRQVKLLFFLAVVFVLQYGFAPYIATQGGPDNATTVPVLRIVRVAFDAGEWGYAAALSTTLLLIMMLMSGLTLLAGRRRAPRGAR